MPGKISPNSKSHSTSGNLRFPIYFPPSPARYPPGYPQEYRLVERTVCLVFARSLIDQLPKARDSHEDMEGGKTNSRLRHLETDRERKCASTKNDRKWDERVGIANKQARKKVGRSGTISVTNKLEGGRFPKAIDKFNPSYNVFRMSVIGFDSLTESCTQNAL